MECYLIAKKKKRIVFLWRPDALFISIAGEIRNYINVTLSKDKLKNKQLICTSKVETNKQENYMVATLTQKKLVHVYK